MNAQRKEYRPKIKIEKTKADVALEIIAFALIGFIWIDAVSAYFSLPNEIPLHFDLHGAPDRYGGKLSLFTLPVLATLVSALLFVLSRYPHMFNYPIKITEANVRAAYSLATQLIRAINAYLAFTFFIIEKETISSAEFKTNEINVLLILILILGSIFLLFVYIVKLGSLKSGESKEQR